MSTQRVICAAVFVAVALLALAVADPELHRKEKKWANKFGENDSTPQQVHVYFASAEAEYVVSWVSFEPFTDSLQSIVEFGSAPEQLDHNSTNLPFAYTDKDSCTNTTRVMHNVRISVQDIVSSSSNFVYYSVYSSAIPIKRKFVLRHLPGNKLPVNIAVFGDLSQMSYSDVLDTTIPVLHSWTAAREMDYAVHFGDIGYNMQDDCGRVGDAFMSDIEYVSTTLPYMFGPGNHENEAPSYSYSQYVNRFQGQALAAAASGSESVRWYSFDQGLIHHVLIDTDAWVYPEVFHLAKPQVEWLEKDLAKVDRTKTPWIIVYGHRAMYCTKSTDPECNDEALSIRTGGIYPLLPTSVGIEPLLLKYGADMYFAGHTHHYERTYPVAKGSATQTNYVQPKGVVHVQSGIAGGAGEDDFTVPQQPWEAYRDTTVMNNNGVQGLRRSTTLLTVYNATTLMMQQVNVYGDVFDSFVLVQNSHGPFA